MAWSPGRACVSPEPDRARSGAATGLRGWIEPCEGLVHDQRCLRLSEILATRMTSAGPTTASSRQRINASIMATIASRLCGLPTRRSGIRTRSSRPAAQERSGTANAAPSRSDRYVEISNRQRLTSLFAAVHPYTAEALLNREAGQSPNLLRDSPGKSTLLRAARLHGSPDSCLRRFPQTAWSISPQKK
jgi:hypothetical protein